MTTAVIGEVLVDLVWRTGSQSIVPIPGGSPANVAVGLHRLGHPALLMTTWGDDPPGVLVREYLDGTGVDFTRADSESGRTTLALAYVDPETGAADYDFLAAWDPAALDVPDEVDLLHTGSLAVVVRPGAERVLEACRRMRHRPGAAVAVDLNVRPGVQPDRAAYRKAVEELLAVTDVVKASDEDLTWLYPDRSPERSARELLALGPRLLVLTRGGAGATGFAALGGSGADGTDGTDGGGGADRPSAVVGEIVEVSVPAPEVDVADTIGAGDAFQSSLLDGLASGEPGGTRRVRLPADRAELAELLRTCVIAGALACRRPGAQPPTAGEIAAARAA